MNDVIAARPVRLLLINPRFPESFWSFRWALDEILPGKRAINPPLGLATLAALCPPHWQVTIVDENVETVPPDAGADIVGVCGMAVQFPRAREWLAHFRARGCYTVAGGSYASLCPERFDGLADSIVAGEAEYTWPQFCRDFGAGQPGPLYRESGVVDLEHSPVPRFDLLRLERYTSVSLQFSRGCPYRCEFCDIIVMFGRRPRTKAPAQVGRELDALRAHGVRSVFFVDDNLIGNRKAARELLRYLADYQARHGFPFTFGTEVSLNLAGDAELLDLFRAAGFAWVFIGIETPDPASLRETRKTQNLNMDPLTAVRTIYASGLDILAGFIVGFDNDTPATFELQHRFILDTGIQASMVGLLTALPHTPLYERLQREGRLVVDAASDDNTKLTTNVIPKQMSRETLIEGYRDLFRRLFSDAGIAQRIRHKMRYLRHPVTRSDYSLRHSLGILARLFTRGLWRGGPLRLGRFLVTLASASRRAWPQVITDWIAGLSMRDYLRRHFERDPAREARLLNAAADWLRRHCPRGLRLDHRAISTHLGAGMAELRLRLGSYAEAAFTRRGARRLRKLLRRSAATLTLQIEHLREDQHRALERLLRRLAPYGDRVWLWIDEKVRARMALDLSAFRLMLARPAD